MRAFALLLTFVLVPCVLAAEPDAAAEAARVLERYLKTPHPVGPARTDPYDAKKDAEVNGARRARLAVLAELAAMPREAVSAAEPVIFKQASPPQRYEIVSTLGERIQTRECAELLHRVFQDVREPKDPDAATYEGLVRTAAVHGLRLMARRVDRSGGKRIQRGPEVEPKVPGLLPYLVSAAGDKAERVRVAALYALADTRDPAAVTELRNRLRDESDAVRLRAACFLTEFQDATGLPEMRQALVRFHETDLRTSGDRAMQAEMLLASLERLTGKSFGEIPLNPLLSSSSSGGEARRYKELLDTWAAWWNWQPDAK